MVVVAAAEALAVLDGGRDGMTRASSFLTTATGAG